MCFYIASMTSSMMLLELPKFIQSIFPVQVIFILSFTLFLLMLILVINPAICHARKITFWPPTKQNKLGYAAGAS